MNNHTDLLSPETSPQRLEQMGVKRVNNMPLVLVIAVLTVFIVLIALVAQKRASMQKKVTDIIQIKPQKTSTLSLAEEVVRDHKPAMVTTANQAEARTEEHTLEQSLPSRNLDEHPVPDAETEHFRQEKMQAFTEAVNAKTSITIDHMQLSTASNMNASAKMSQAVISDTNYQSQNQLAQNTQHTGPGSLTGDEDSLRWRLNSTLESPNSRYELRAGNVIPGVMISGISSELPGQIIGQVSQNIYDTATGKYLLIPQGTRLIGVYSSDVNFGQNSVLIVWQRLVFPDGKALDIGSMPGADSTGFAGFRDQVDHHYARIYGSALLMSGIVGGVAYSQNTNQSNKVGESVPTASSVLSQALGQQLGEVSSQLMAKNINISPTIQIRPGYRFNIIVVKDLTFQQAYQQFAY